MVELEQRAVEEAIHEGESMRTRDLVDILERYHDDRPGISKAAVDAYAQELVDRDDIGFDAGTFRDVIKDELTAGGWVDEETLYELDDERISQYPQSWHDRLHGETDPVEYLRFLLSEVPSAVTEEREGARGVKKNRLLDVMKADGQLDHRSAATAVETARSEGRLEEDAYQHPRAGVYLTDG